ncbi:MAG: nucleotidyltransferase domain-containing protein [Phycisphaerae bacterium]
MDRPFLDKVTAALRKAFGPRLQGIVLYGSEARGESGPDSDIDLLVLLEDGPRQADDSWRCVDAVYDLVLESGRLIHAVPVNVKVYEAAEFQLYRNAQREGVAL